MLAFLLLNPWRTACLVLLLLCSVQLVAGKMLLLQRNEARAELVKAVLVAKVEAAKLKAAQDALSAKATVTYVDRIQVVRGKTLTIVKEVPVYVPADSPDLPPGFRVLHDAAAQGELPDPARVADAAPVPAQDAAATVAGNYGTCHETETQLTALQDWIRGQQQLGK